MKKLEDWDYVTLRFDPNPSGKYVFGYWVCTAEPGYTGTGNTPLEAMTKCLIAISKAFIREQDEDSKTN